MRRIIASSAAQQEKLVRFTKGALALVSSALAISAAAAAGLITMPIVHSEARGSSNGARVSFSYILLPSSGRMLANCNDSSTGSCVFKLEHGGTIRSAEAAIGSSAPFSDVATTDRFCAGYDGSACKWERLSDNSRN